jgi:hypothetical protein
MGICEALSTQITDEMLLLCMRKQQRANDINKQTDKQTNKQSSTPEHDRAVHCLRIKGAQTTAQTTHLSHPASNHTIRVHSSHYAFPHPRLAVFRRRPPRLEPYVGQPHPRQLHLQYQCRVYPLWTALAQAP